MKTIVIISMKTRWICISRMCCCCGLFGTRAWSCLLCCRVTCWGNRIWRFEGLVGTWLISMDLSYLSSTEWCFAFCYSKTKQGRIRLEAKEGPWWPSLSVAITIVWKVLTSVLISWRTTPKHVVCHLQKKTVM